MMLEETAQKFFKEKFCKAGAQAVRRYAKVTGSLPKDDMPEYFLSSFLFDALGDEDPMSLETRVSSLRLRPISDLGYPKSPRIDLVIYKDRHLPKDRENLLALVEFKSGSVWQEKTQTKPNTDREKLIVVLKTCPAGTYGVICGWVHGEVRYKNSLEYSESAGDWPCWEPFKIEGATEPHFFGVSVFTAQSVATRV
jgi:hypothetical protein